MPAKKKKITLSHKDAVALRKIIQSGYYMSNLLYNAAQDPEIPADWRESFCRWREDFDEKSAKVSYGALLPEE